MLQVSQINNQDSGKIVKLAIPNQQSYVKPKVELLQSVLDENNHRVINKLIGSILGQYQQQQWIKFNNDQPIQQIVYIDIEVQQSKFQWMIQQKLLAFISDLQNNQKLKFEDQNINDYYLEVLLGYKTSKQRRYNKQLSIHQNLYNRYSSFKLEQYQLIQNKYPRIQNEDQKNFKMFAIVQLKEQEFKIEQHIMCLDCEMVITTQGFELARISMINYNFQVIMDELVKPTNEIVNYNTKFSGITEQMLMNVKTTLQDIQQKLMKIINNKTILIGHSLQNDLKCLKMIHSNIIDTSVLYLMNGRKQQLKNLTFNYLKKNIQKGSHDSVQDCKSTLGIAKLYIQILNQLQKQQEYDSINLLQQFIKYKKYLLIQGKSEDNLIKLGDKLNNHLKNQYHHGANTQTTNTNNSLNQNIVHNLICHQYRVSQQFQSWQDYYYYVDNNLQQIYNKTKKDTCIQLIIYNNIQFSSQEKLYLVSSGIHIPSITTLCYILDQK